MSVNQVDYTGKKVVVTGGASGMGEAVVKMIAGLGAEIYMLDIKAGNLPVKQFIPVNLAQKDSIDAAVAALPGDLSAVFHCAGVAGKIYLGNQFTELDVVTINYIGLRYAIEQLTKKMKPDSAIVLVSSIAGFNFRHRIADFTEFVLIDDWDEAVNYISARTEDPKFLRVEADPNRPYSLAKECVCIYAMYRSWSLAEKRIRINTISPGGTQTPMHDDFLEIVGMPRGLSMPVSPIGREASPEEMASVMLFLNSDMASYLSGQDICVDYALSSSWTFQGMEEHDLARDKR